MSGTKVVKFLFFAWLLALGVLALSVVGFQYKNQAFSYGHVFVTTRLSLLVHLFISGCLFIVVWLLLRVLQVSVSARRNILMLLGSTLVTILVLETLLRLTALGESLQNYGERSRGYYLRVYENHARSAYHTHSPNSTITLKSLFFSYPRQTNSLGISFPEIPIEKEPGEIRIMALGDSFTEGDGAPADSTWMKALERELRQRYPYVRFTFINAGVCGSDPVFAFRLFKDKLLVYRPDIVLAATNLSDLDDLIMRGGRERFFGNDSCRFRRGPRWENIYAFSYLFRLFIHTRYNKIFLTPEEDRQKRKEAVAEIAATFNQFHDLCEASGCRFIAVLMPVTVDVTQEKLVTIGQLADTLGADPPFPVINLLPYYLNKGGINKYNVHDYYWPMDGHHTSRGYEIFGKGVADYLITHRMVADSLQQSEQ
ncbi:MAG: hypothetical protein KatS3mg031_0859 [Chitinophagales bacterium]|nr:MAG: hypothetical protein KatS3mg031_0859 [Chitinophagales bacterium]